MVIHPAPPRRTPASSAYRFVTRWRIKASREEDFDVLTDSKSLSRWWPSVYRRVDQLA